MTVPIVPGPGEPEPPTPAPQVVYVQPQRADPTRVAGNTVLVIIIIVTVLCVLPLLACGVLALVGNLGALFSH
jgi:hypothetical protein